ncbi:MAG: phage tail protein [Enterobacter cloacae]|nr:phage tail protein [Enterobacter cloacae]
MQVGAFGFGGRPSVGFENFDATQTTYGSTENPIPGLNMFGLTILHSGIGYAAQIAFRGNNGFWYRAVENSVRGSWIRAYDTANTTKASDGTLKAASPVARIVASQEACQRADIAEDGFSWCGCGTANAEAEGITLSRLEAGVYLLTGSAGLASEGWQLLPPMDPGGMGELGVVEAEQTDNGELRIRLFKRKYMLSEDGEIIKTKGELMDVPANSWIDVRLDMPSDSLFNQRMNQELPS